MKERELRDEVHKRLTLNWLIQGASQHVGLTLHHLVRDELTAIHPDFPLAYDQYTLMGLLQYWRPIPVLLFDWPPAYWRRAARRESHPFFHHRLLSRHGGELAESGRQRALARAKEKGVSRAPFMFSIQLLRLSRRVELMERNHPQAIEEVAKGAAASVWGISRERLRGEIIRVLPLPAIGPIQPPRNVRERMFLMGAAGWGGVMRDASGQLCVVATAINGCLLAKELVKGTAELICLHGLSELSEEHYQHVIAQTDRLEFEPPMIQTGGELWRRLLLSMPVGLSVANVLMGLARLPPEELESVIEDVIEQRTSAGARLARIESAE